MSQTFNANGSSVSKERTAGQRDRYAHGSGIGVAVSMSGTQEDAEAAMDHFLHNFKPPEEYTWQINVGHGSFVFSVQWNVKETANAATSTQEEGIPTS